MKVKADQGAAPLLKVQGGIKAPHTGYIAEIAKENRATIFVNGIMLNVPARIFGVEIFKNDGPTDSATLVPLVFPLIAGAASFTTLLSLRAEYNVLNIIVAVALNMLFVYFVLKKVDYVQRVVGKGGVYVLRKFFGIILLAIAVRLFTSNLNTLLDSLK